MHVNLNTSKRKLCYASKIALKKFLASYVIRLILNIEVSQRIYLVDKI